METVLEEKSVTISIADAWADRLRKKAINKAVAEDDLRLRVVCELYGKLFSYH